jgi:hypothetical protein
MLRPSTLCLSLSLSLAGCAARETVPAESAPAEPAPAYQQPAAPSTLAGEGETFATLEQAESALARAEQELVALQGGPAATGGAPPAAAPTTGPADAPAAAEPAPPPAPPPPRAEGESAAQAEKKSDDKAQNCASLCRAFASLARAADAVCRLSGEEGERCTRARGSVRSHFQRVAVCRCTL